MTLHPGLAPVADLVGTWRGPGHGEYPTINDFDYSEEVTFTDIGKPFLAYAQRTFSPTGALMHVETGYLRLPEGGRVELVLALPTGQTELGHGTLTREPLALDFEARVDCTDSAKRVEATRRRWRLDGDHLVTELDMAAVEQPMTRHLSSRLTRVKEDS